MATMIEIKRCWSGFGEWDIVLGASRESIPLYSMERREAIEGLVHHGGPGGQYIQGRVYQAIADEDEIERYYVRLS